jgi:hypothetical protein
MMLRAAWMSGKMIMAAEEWESEPWTVTLVKKKKLL